jgi:hypothetical protein
MPVQWTNKFVSWPHAYTYTPKEIKSEMESTSTGTVLQYVEYLIYLTPSWKTVVPGTIVLGWCMIGLHL